MKIACLTVLLLVVATSSTPTLHKKFYRGIFPGWKVVKGHNRVVGFPYPCIKGYGVLGHLGYLARGIRGDRVGNTIDILRTVAGYRLPGTFDGSVNIIIELGRVCGLFVDVIIPGLGQLLSNLVFGLSRILICVLGSPSFFGIKFQDRRPGFGSGSDNYFICQPNYGSKWGWKLFQKGYRHHDLILDSYGIRHAGLKADKLIKKATRGRGIDSLPWVENVKTDLRGLHQLTELLDAHRLIVLWIRELCDLADRDIKRWNKNDLLYIYIRITSMIGAYGRSCQRGLGVRIVDGISLYVKVNFENYGLTGITDAQNTIKINIGKFDQNSFGGVIIPFDGDFVDDDSHDDNSDTVVAKDDDDSDDTAVTVATPTYDGSLRDQAQVEGIAKLVQRILNFKINLANDVFSLVFRLIFGVSGLIDATISGLGSLLARIIAVIFKIGICFKGFPGDRSICNKGWNQQFNVNGEASNAADLIVLFKLGQAQEQVNGYIKSWTKGQGIKAASGSVRILLEHCSSLSVLITNYQNISKETIATAVVTVTTITAAMANANKKDSGKQITRLIPVCGQRLKDQGYPDITNRLNKIEITIVNANGDNSVNWTKDTGTNKDLDNDDNDNDGNTDNDDNNHGNGSNTGNNNNDNSNNSGNNDNNGSNDNDTDKDTGKGKDTGKDNGKGKDTDNGKDTGNSKDTGKDNGKGKDTGNDKDTDNSKDTGKGKDTGKDNGKGKDTGNDKDTGNSKDTGKGKDTDDNNGNKGNNSGDNNGDNKGNDNTGSNNNNNGDNSGNSGKGSNTGGNKGDNTGNDNNSGYNTGNNGQGSGSTDVDGSGSVTVDIGVLISGALKGLPGVTKINSNILNELISIKLNSFDDVINLSVKLCIGLGGVIDTVFTGLGSILSRLLAVILKIAFCVNKFPGNRGICNKAWNAKFGINGDASTAKDLVALFRVQKCKSDIQTMIDTYSGGKGIAATPIPIIFQKVLDLSDIVTSLTITKQHVSTCFVNIFTIFGTITNSYKQNSGTGAIQKIVPSCGRYFVKQGYPDITVQQKTIINIINGANNGKIDWKSGKKFDSGRPTDVKGDGLVTGVKDLFKDVKNDKNVDQTTVTAALNIEIPRSFDDVLVFCNKVIQALGSIIDLFISGLGSILVRIFSCLLRYIVCVSGASRNSNNFVCQKAYYDSFGVTVNDDSWDSIVTGFNLKTVANDVDIIVNSYTKNKGRGSLKGCEKICFDQVYAFLNIFNKGTKISDSDLTACFGIVTTLLGGFANSWSVDLGKQICDNMIPVSNSFLTKNNYPALDGTQKIYTNIQIANGVEAPWTKGTTTTVINN